MISLQAKGFTRFCAPTCTAVAPASIISSTSSALATPPTDCAGAEALLKQVGTDCKACHQDFRG